MGCFRTGGDAVVRPTVTVMGASDNLTPAAQLAVSNEFLIQLGTYRVTREKPSDIRLSHIYKLCQVATQSKTWGYAKVISLFGAFGGQAGQPI